MATTRTRTRYPGPVNKDLKSGVLWPDNGFYIALDTNRGSDDGAWGGFSYWAGGTLLWIDYGDGWVCKVGDLDHTYADSSVKHAKLWLPANWNTLETIELGYGHFVGSPPSFNPCSSLWKALFDHNGFTGSIPSMAGCVALQKFLYQNCSLSGVIPSFGTCTALKLFNVEQNQYLSGTIPSFAGCTALQEFYATNNLLSGTIPSFASCTALTTLQMAQNSLTGYESGGFATQKNLADIQFWTNALTETAVNTILHDCVTSLGGGRVTANLELQGGTNHAPTGQGITDKATLITAGWSVNTN